MTENKFVPVALAGEFEAWYATVVKYVEPADIAAWMHDAWDAGRASAPAPVSPAIGSEWMPCMKLPVVVHVREQRPGEAHVSTREGITPVKPDDLIMRGVSGEEYPIGRAIFEQTYKLIEATGQEDQPAAGRTPAST